MYTPLNNSKSVTDNGLNNVSYVMGSQMKTVVPFVSCAPWLSMRYERKILAKFAMFFLAEGKKLLFNSKVVVFEL